MLLLTSHLRCYSIKRQTEEQTKVSICKITHTVTLLWSYNKHKNVCYMTVCSQSKDNLRYWRSTNDAHEQLSASWYLGRLIPVRVAFLIRSEVRRDHALLPTVGKILAVFNFCGDIYYDLPNYMVVYVGWISQIKNIIILNTAINFVSAYFNLPRKKNNDVQFILLEMFDGYKHDLFVLIFDDTYIF